MLRKVEKFTVKAVLQCLLSAVLLALPFINGEFWILAWVGFLPFFVSLQNKTKLQAFFLAYLTGVFFWLFTIYWLVHVTLLGMILLVLYLALYFGIFGLLVFYSMDYGLWTVDLMLIPLGWVLCEYLRSHLLTGFPWALLGYSQYLNLQVIQIADVTGVWGVSFLVVLVNITIYQVTSDKLQVTSSRVYSAIVTGAILLTVLIFGFDKLNSSSFTTYPSLLKISVIQGNIPQNMKWEAYSREYIVDTYLRLSREAAKDKPDLVIWPEAALPVIAEEGQPYYEKVKDLAKEINIPLLLGAVTCRQGRYYNSALLISRDGLTLAAYDKVHLVPFGEYIPLRHILGFLKTIVPIGEITAGKEHTVFDTPAQFSVLICFEDLFPALSSRCIKAGARFLVNITNDAWYKKTPAAYQHLAASVFRAVENRVFLIRAANTGISAFISPEGKIISSVKDKLGTEIFVTGHATQAVFADKGGG